MPWCGRWKVTDLVVHLARVHHWAAAQARRTNESPLGRGPFVLTDLYATCAEELLSTLRELDPSARAHTLLDDGVPLAEQTGTVGFWHRRQKLETLVHLWDLRTAADLGDAVGIATDDVWWDCVQEVVGVMHPRQVRLGRVAAPGVHVVLRRPDGVATVLAGGLEPAVLRELPSVTVTGSPSDLAPLVWGRLDLGDDRLDVDGDGDGGPSGEGPGARRRLRALLDAGLTP